MDLQEKILHLIKLCATSLPEDVESALVKSLEQDGDNPVATNVLESIKENVSMARKNGTPICQDTGALTFYISYPVSITEKSIREAVEAAVISATKEKQYLRPNSVDPITGKNPGNNLGDNTPYMNFHQWDKDYLEIKLMLKGGGSENVATQYTLPNQSLAAGRDIKGIKKAVVDAVYKAQGDGCAPGVIGVCAGGDRVTSMAHAKKQLYRKLGERSPDSTLAAMETDLVAKLNTLNIGPMGTTGKTTVLDVLAGTLPRHPATFYVSVSYNCWALRRYTLTIKGEEITYG